MYVTSSARAIIPDARDQLERGQIDMTSAPVQMGTADWAGNGAPLRMRVDEHFRWYVTAIVEGCPNNQRVGEL
jgi:hypothetical protein